MKNCFALQLTMSQDLQLILFDEDGKAFEALAKENGKRTWSARELMVALGYDDWSAFRKIVEKAMAACSLLGGEVKLFDHFSKGLFVNAAGREVEDITMSRFACGMTVLNGDSRNRNIAAAQAYFISIAEIFAGFPIHHAESMDRIFIRDEISDRELTLSETAARAGVESHQRFNIAGYVGMYEMDYQEIRRLRNVSDKPKRSMLDFMGKDELAGNLFRLALTEGRIKKERTHGQFGLELVAREVGSKIRHVMHEETGLYPEQLPTAQDIKDVRSGLKRAGSKLFQLDDVKAEREAERTVLDAALPQISPDAIDGCAECAGGNAAPHFGSRNCQSGAIASGGSLAHCTCEYCY